ncbi:MAG: hypothetical protein SOZ34_09150, partial [Clostridia bacterium]|nr:hypothetical protein [Clostridia bacterium]
KGKMRRLFFLYYLGNGKRSKQVALLRDAVVLSVRVKIFDFDTRTNATQNVGFAIVMYFKSRKRARCAAYFFFTISVTGKEASRLPF